MKPWAQLVVIFGHQLLRAGLARARFEIALELGKSTQHGQHQPPV
jgi:hypothetical protein